MAGGAIGPVGLLKELWIALTGHVPPSAATLSWEDICYRVRVGGAAQLRQVASGFAVGSSCSLLRC